MLAHLAAAIARCSCSIYSYATGTTFCTINELLGQSLSRQTVVKIVVRRDECGSGSVLARCAERGTPRARSTHGEGTMLGHVSVD